MQSDTRRKKRRDAGDESNEWWVLGPMREKKWLHLQAPMASGGTTLYPPVIQLNHHPLFAQTLERLSSSVQNWAGITPTRHKRIINPG